MKRATRNLLAGLIVLGSLTTPNLEARAETYDVVVIKNEQGEKIVDETKVYYGILDIEKTDYEDITTISYEEIIKATPEYKEIKKEKIESGTGKYGILISKASDRTHRAIGKYGEKINSELIIEESYLERLEITPSNPNSNQTLDKTQEIIKLMQEDYEANKNLEDNGLELG